MQAPRQTTGSGPPGGSYNRRMPAIDTEEVRQSVIDSLKTVFDPEIPVNIYDMGMIYEVRVEENGFAFVKMTLTSPACPVAGSLPGEVEIKVAGVEGVTDAKVELVWDPPWSQAMLSEAAKLQLGLM
jgi:FeS assembly SUF system protein